MAALDGSEATTRVLDAAVSLASSYPSSELHLTYVLGNAPASELPVTPGPMHVSLSEQIEAGQKLLAEWSTQARTRFLGPLAVHLAAGEPWHEIVQTASHVSADLVIMGTHGRSGLKRLLVGSVAETVVRRAPCPVLVVRPKGEQPIEAAEHSQAQTGIEPPCPDCVAERQTTHQMWCARHRQHHPTARLHFKVPQSFGVGSNLIRG